MITIIIIIIIMLIIIVIMMVKIITDKNALHSKATTRLF